MKERTLTVPRTARYWTAGGGRAPSELWLVCHGYGQLAGRFIRHFEGIAGEARLVVAPEALSRFYLATPGPGGASDGRVGASWMTREARDEERRDQLTFLDAVMADVVAILGRRPPVLRALGFSQGAATVCRWLAARGVVPDQLILWGGTIPSDMPHEEARRLASRAPLTVIVGSADEFIPPPILSDLESGLAAARVPYRLLRFAGGHRLNSELLRQLASETIAN